MAKKKKKAKNDTKKAKKGKKGKGKKKKKGVIEPAPIEVPVFMDKSCIRTQILRSRVVLNVSTHNSRRGRLGNSVLNEIEPACKNWSTLRELHVWGHQLHEAKRLATQLLHSASSKHIHTLILNGNALSEWNNHTTKEEEGHADTENNAPPLPNGLEDPVAALLTLPSLTHLDLSFNKYSHFSDEFYLQLNSAPQLRRLNVSGNAIGSTGLGTLLEMLPSDSALEELSLQSCTIGPTGLTKLVQTLLDFRLTNIRVLKLRDNLFGCGGSLDHLSEAALLRPMLSIVLDSITLNKKNYQTYTKTLALMQQSKKVATIRLVNFFRKITHHCKEARLIKEAQDVEAAAAAAELEKVRLKEEKEAAKAAAKAAKAAAKAAKKKGKKGKKEKEGAGAAKKKEKKSKKEKGGKKKKEKKKKKKK